MLRYCDVFSGIGGFSLAMTLAGHILGMPSQCVYAVDIDAAAVKTFNMNNSYQAQCADVRKIENLPEHDIMFGGFPCQPFSRNNPSYPTGEVRESDARSDLFLELTRLLRKNQPRYFIFENVKGIQNLKRRGESVFSEILTSFESAGYRVYHDILDAADFGVPQQRRRVIFVGIRNDISCKFIFPIQQPRISALCDILQKQVPEHYLLRIRWKNRILKNLVPEKVNHPFSSGVSRYEAMNWLYNGDADNPRTHLSAPSGILESTILYGDTPSGMSRQADRVYDPLGIAPTIATFGIPAVASSQGLRQLTPRECARLQGFPDSFILPDTDSIAYKQIGNAICVLVIAAVIRNLLEEQSMRIKRTKVEIAEGLSIEQVRERRQIATPATSTLPALSSLLNEKEMIAKIYAQFQNGGFTKEQLIHALQS